MVPGIEENKAKVERASAVLKERGANIAIFPEYCLSGYFWEDEEACWAYMEQAVTDRHLGWIDESLRPLLDDDFRAIMLNNIRRGSGRKFLNTTFIVANEISDPLADEFAYNKVFLPGVEKTYLESGRDDRLILSGKDGGTKLGFTTCYDYLFNDLLREYAVVDEVDAHRDRLVAGGGHPGLPRDERKDRPLLRGSLEQRPGGSVRPNQVWTVACNAVGRHGISGAAFWGGSGSGPRPA